MHAPTPEHIGACATAAALEDAAGRTDVVDQGAVMEKGEDMIIEATKQVCLCVCVVLSCILLSCMFVGCVCWLCVCVCVCVVACVLLVCCFVFA